MSLKKSVLQYLIKQNKAVSGQEMASCFHVSRGAIWKAIQALIMDGYSIVGKNNVGYQIQPPLDLVSEEYLAAYLLYPYHIELLDCVDSTSTYASMLSHQIKEDCLVCASTQTGGRGRTENHFYSPEGGLYFSFTLKPKDEEVDLSLITIRVGMAVIHALETLTNRQCQIKWVNDVYYERKKVCGILSEASIDYESNAVLTVIIGIGINLNILEFPEELKEKAGSLNVQQCDKNLLIASIINEIRMSTVPLMDIIAEYKSKCLLMGKEIFFTYNHQSMHGIAYDINNEGNLLVKVSDQTITLKSGEVSLGRI